MPSPSAKLSEALGQVDPEWIEAVQRINAVMQLDLEAHTFRARRQRSLLDGDVDANYLAKRVASMDGVAWYIAELLFERRHDNGLDEVIKAHADELIAGAGPLLDEPELAFLDFLRVRLVDDGAERQWPSFSAAFTNWVVQDPALAIGLIRVRQIGQNYRKRTRLAW